MDPPIKLFGQTIAKVASSAFTASCGEGEEAEAAATTSSGRWSDVPFSSQEVKETGTDTSGAVDVDGDGLTCIRQDPKSGSLPDLSTANNSADEEMLAVSPRGEGIRVDENRNAHVTPLASQSEGRAGAGGGVGEDENSEDEEGSQISGRGKKESAVAGGGGGGESEYGKGGEKIPRRPENAVACPRCHSLETKFCYYNNYNVNQPRHFCKHCQRYWTAGGTLRNVPVGAGRRKNKHTSSTISPRGQTPEAGTVRGDAPDTASPLIVTKGVVQVPIQVSLVQGAGGNAGVMRMAVPATSDPSVLPLLRMQPQQMDPSIFMSTSEAGTSSDTGTVPCKRSRLATPGYSETSTGANDMDQQQQQGCWVQKSSTNKEESACSPLTPTSNNIIVHEIKGEPGGACSMIGVAPASPLTGPVVGVPDQQHTVTNNNTLPCPGAWSGANSQATMAPHGATGGGPFGFYNGGWPYGYNVGVGWNGPPAFCPGGVAPAGTPGVTGPPPPGGIAAAWNGITGSVWTGVPWPMPGLAWGPAWAMAPWAMATAGPGGVSMGPMTQTIPMSSGAGAGILAAPMPSTTTTTAAGPGSPPSSLGKHSRGGGPQLAAAAAAAPACEGGGRGKVDGNGGLWAPKSLRMADPEEAVRSSVWRILGVRSIPSMTTSSTFSVFQTRNEAKKIADDDQQVVQASLHANPAAMSRSMIFRESN
ncbi:hypothetical protein R1sor_018080 [Riccia sorocarpa]|uniref:Dof-type domain-containing protein n=1 Tax=Riccia sorocarpa TaxID=122646 RepID=A0ABD3I8N8_9MARC